MPALHVSTDRGPFASDDCPPNARSTTPTPPTYSPITPEMSASLPATTSADPSNPHPYAPPSHHPQPHPPEPPIIPAQPPPPVPISESTNPDAIALRAAISILQLQRQRALSDMQTLERQKEEAMANPEAFSANVASGRIQARSTNGILPPSDSLGDDDEEEEEEEEEQDDDDDEKMDEGDDSTPNPRRISAFANGIPSAQNVVRAPPINWAKYHIIGESLDKLHEAERAAPTPGAPRTDEDVMRERNRRREAVLAAPYDPWSDMVGEKDVGVRTRSGRGKRG